MSSPPRDTPVLSSSPASIRGASPVRRRDTGSQSDIDRPRHSPTVARSYDHNDPQVRERQRTMDVDMAMQLSRARRETISVSPAVSSSPYEIRQAPSSEHSLTFPAMTTLSPHEQHQIDLARGEILHTVNPENGVPDEEDEAIPRPGRASSFEFYPHLNQSHDPSLLVSLGPQASHTNIHSHTDPDPPAFGLPTYQADALIAASNYDFSPMEQFASAEKAVLGLTSPPVTRFSVMNSLRLPPESEHQPQQTDTDDASAIAGPSTSDFSISLPRPARHRKISQSNTNPRLHRKGIGGKMALFEGNPGEPPPSLPGRLGVLLSGGGGPNSRDSTDDIAVTSSAPLPNTIGGILNTGHDRPYRFSFYSNALSATIHARSLSELPAEGQTFQDLFTGAPAPAAAAAAKSNSAPSISKDRDRPTSTSPAGTARQEANNNSGNPTNGNGGYFNPKFKPPTMPGAGMTGGMIGGGDTDGNTWWLDVQSPTDEEMKMLSKVFNIHPLTTEDIQMEETREKIELFRHYYLVCFRSFDQDPYSPTHLEPLNMYIIVFREGTLSFHFRPTPHPQNVRRRIKQLKDYISVTSDWISYALIDDITDAFGPLIQSIEYEVDSIDELVLILKEAEQSDMLRRIGTCRKKVMGLLRLMGNKADVVKGLAKRCNENWRVAPTSDIGLYLSDIQDHLITMTQNLNHYEKILSRSHSNYLAQISIEMTDANNQINDVLSKLTALGTVLIPMNLVTGLWGMNVHVPGENVEGYHWFISIIAGLAAFAFIGGYSTYKFMVGR